MLNIADGGQGGNLGSVVNNKISKALKNHAINDNVMKMFCSKKSIEHRHKISDSLKGRIPWNKGKKNIYSKETLEKMRVAKKDFVPWNKGKKSNYVQDNPKELYLAVEAFKK
jgi:hypothetical protein